MAIALFDLVRMAERRAERPFSHIVPRSCGGVRHVVSRAPEECTKCHSREIFSDRTEPRRIACFSCGYDWFLL